MRERSGAQGPERLARITASDRSLLSKSSLTVVARVVSKLAQLGWLVLAARLLDVDEFAQYGYVVAIALTFCLLSDAGVATITARDIASGATPPGQAFWGAVPLVAIVGALVAVLFCLFLTVSSGPGVGPASILAGGAFVLANRVFDLSATSLRGLGRIEFEAVLQIGNAVVFVALASAVALAGGGVALVLLVLALKELLAAAVAAPVLRRDVGPYRHVPLRSTLGLLRAGLLISMGAFALSVATRLPLVVLGNVSTPFQVALFAAAVRFADTAVTLSQTVGFGLMPGLANVYARDDRRARRLIGRSIGFMVLLGVVVAVPFVLLREQVATLAFGSSYAAAGEPLGILMGGLAVFTSTGIAWFALLALGRERIVFTGALAGVAASAVSSVLLADSAGGAAVAYVGGMAVVAVVLMAGLLVRSSSPAAAASSAAAVPGSASGGA